MLDSSRVLQNVVFPSTPDADLAVLYVDAAASGSGLAAELIASRTSLRVPSGTACSLATYFNAFPASYWQRWSSLDQIVLTVATRGAGTIRIFRSHADGTAKAVSEHTVTGATTTTVTLPLTGFDDGGWYWFDLAASETELVLENATYTTDAAPARTGKLSVGMTTFNKPEYCLGALAQVTANDELVANIDRFFVVDQGNKRVRDEAGFNAVEQQLGDKLHIIEQPNLGGSGGFARNMAETLQRDDTEFLLLLDDDVELETESVLRALQFARYSTDPIIVGGHMLELDKKSVVRAWAEIIAPESFGYMPSEAAPESHDFRKTNLRQTPWAHQRVDADYNAWWMCLIPKAVIAEIGLPLPVFIKWDDVEYGVRAGAAGYSTVTLPGVGIWHMSWDGKNDWNDWQAYFLTRNRIVAGLLHTDAKVGRKMMFNTLQIDIKALLNMRYYPTQLSVDAMRAVLAGPEHLHEGIANVLPNARARAAEFPETTVYPFDDPAAPTAPVRKPEVAAEDKPKGPRGASLATFAGRRTAAAWFGAGDPQHPIAPQVEYPKNSALWWDVPRYRSVLVETADGRGKVWLRRDQKTFRRLLREARKLNRQIAKQWDELAATYREAQPTFTSSEAWQQTFAGR